MVNGQIHAPVVISPWKMSLLAMDRGQDGPQSRLGCCEEISHCSEKSNQHFSALLPVAWSLNRLSYPVSGNITAEQIKRVVKYRTECEYSLLCSIMIVILLSNSSPSQPDVASRQSCHICVTFPFFPHHVPLFTSFLSPFDLLCFAVSS